MKKEINIIGVSARIGGGKDVFASIVQYLSEDFDREKYFENWLSYSSSGVHKSEWQIKKFAYKLKLIASILTGIPVENFEDQDFKKTFLGKEWNLIRDELISGDKKRVSWTEENLQVRSFLQILGTEAIRNNVHKNAWLNSLWCDYTPEQKWIITDMRFPNELESVKNHGGITVRLTRNSHVQSSHESETALDNHEFDYVIDNSGTTLEDMYNLVVKFYEEYLK